MNQQMMQNQIINNINTDSAISSILDNLSEDYVYHIITDSINMKFRPYSTPMPNIPYALEMNFNVQMNAVPSSRDQILAKREEVYLQIIEILCNYYNLEYHRSDDIYSDAFYLYKFLVSDFTNTVIRFYVNYILKEKKHLYTDLNLHEKKNKDSSYVYSKKIYSNSVIATIHANIIPIIQDICAYDISLQNILDYRYIGDEAIAAYHISHIVSDRGYFYDYIRCYMANECMPDVINCVKMELQSNTGDMIRDKIQPNEEV